MTRNLGRVSVQPRHVTTALPDDDRVAVEMLETHLYLRSQGPNPALEVIPGAGGVGVFLTPAASRMSMAASGTPGRCNATRPAEVTADSCASLVGMVDTADELLRAELQRAIWEYLLRTKGSAPEVEIREWSRVDEPSLLSPESSYRGELFLSLRRLSDDANHKDLHSAAERLRRGFELGVVDERLKMVAVEELPPGVFNDEGGKRVTLGLWLRVHV